MTKPHPEREPLDVVARADEDDVRPPQPVTDAEIDALVVVIKILAPFDSNARARMLTCAVSFFGLRVP